MPLHMLACQHAATFQHARSPERVRRRLSQAVSRALEAPQTSDARIIRVEVPAPEVDPLAWLHAQPHAQKLYWSGRDDGVAIAGVEAADGCVGATRADVDRLQARQMGVAPLEDDRVRYYGGFRFDAEAEPDAAWASFGTYRFVLPRFELARRRGETVLACNLVLPRDGAHGPRILSRIAALAFPLHRTPGRLPLPVTRHDHPGPDAWRRDVEQALRAFRRTALEKVVLARKAVFGFAERLDPALLLFHLQAATPNCFHFCFQPVCEAAFVGASPERLFRREGGRIVSEAVAGTRPRGASASVDARLLEELMGSDKEQREHGYVRRNISETLAAFCDALDVDARASEMKLARGRHLYSGIEGVLHDGVQTLDVLRALHPTPAVGGYPKEAARQAIRRLEGFDRGWYAGPVGWIGREKAEFAVAIRSGLVRPGRLSLFSGAGLVEGSMPEGEWREIEQKISDFVNVLGLDVRAA